MLSILLCVVVLSAASSVLVVGLTPSEWSVRAQCQAACLTKFGYVRTDPFTHIYDIYRVHKCSTDQCRQCLNPCNWIVSTSTICQRQCVTEGCRESCRLLYSLREKVYTTRVFERSGQNLSLEAPTVVCKETVPRLPFSGPDLAQLFLRWNIRDSDGNSTLAPVVFIIAVKGQRDGREQEHWTILGKTSYAFLPIQNLTAGGTYKFQVTAVTDDGVVDEPKETEWATTLAEGAVGDPPQDIRVVQQTVSGNSMAAIVEWTPGRDPACYFKMFWMTTGETQYREEKIREPLPQPKLKLKGLRFGMNYTLQSYAFDRDFQRSSPNKGSGWLVTTECLDATGHNFTICSPGPVLKLSHRVLGWHGADQLAEVTVYWQPPRFASKRNNITSYIIEWKRAPSLHSILPVAPHQNDTVISGNRTSVTLSGLHMNSVYGVWVRAQTAGGTGRPSKLLVSIGGENSFRVASVQRYDQPMSSAGLNDSVSVVALSVAPVVFATLVLAAVLLVRWRRKQKPEFPNQKVACLREVNPLYGFNDSLLPEIKLDYSHILKDKYEIRWEDLTLLEAIGEGAFGRVMKAQLISGPLKTQTSFVAVKMTRDQVACEEEKRDLLLEIDLMKELGQHQNVVSILGCCTQGPNIGLIMDYCPLGDLRNYLKNYRSQGYCDVTRSSVCQQTSVGDSGLGPSKVPFPGAQTGTEPGGLPACGGGNHCYTNPGLDATIYPSDDLEEPECGITDTQLLSYAWQIAGGMEYLTQKKYVHRDLAARNVLMYEHNCVKISDFGLTRDVYETSVYTPTVGKKVPFKWMPLEAILDQTFTSKSDVWSFGIVLWEILTMGSTPYPGIDSRELLSLLKNGYRMGQPDKCKDEVYELMLKCWREKPADRPTFTNIRSVLGEIMELDQSYMDLKADPEDELPDQSTRAFGSFLTPTTSSVLLGETEDSDVYGMDNPMMVCDGDQPAESVCISIPADLTPSPGPAH